MNLANLLRRMALAAGSRPAVLLGEHCIADYQTLANRVARIAQGLRQQLQLQPGDRVGLFMANDPAFLELLYACWWAGLAVVPINAKLHPREALYILQHSQAQAVFCTANLIDDLRAELASDAAGDPPIQPTNQPPLRCLLADAYTASPAYDALLQAPPLPQPVHRSPDDLAWLFYTSGTTGKPKGVMLTHRNLMTMTLCYFSDVDAVTADDSVLYAAPMSHGAGLYGLPLMLIGGRHIIPASRGFDAAEVLDLAQRHRGVTMFAAPTIVKRIVDEAQARGLDGDGIKTIVYGGGPMYVEDIQRAIRVMGPRFVQIYGQGESPMTITALSRQQIMDTDHPQHLARIGSVGVAQAAVEVRVTDADGRDLPLGETGEVLVRGDTVMAGYWRDSDATARAIRDGWLFTGDMGSLDAHGFLTLRDRSKDLIISGGSNIYPREVEEVLLRHPQVAEVSVVGQADPEWGEIVVAFIAPIAGIAPQAFDTAELDALCHQHIGRFKRPKAYRVMAELPKNNYGKILKTELRKLLVQPASAE